MRRWLGLGLLLLGVFLLVPVQAQQQASSFFTGVTPRDIKFQPIDVNQAIKPTSVNKSFRNPHTPGTFNMSNIFHRPSSPSWPPKVASAPVLKGKNPFQPKVFGWNPFAPLPKTK